MGNAPIDPLEGPPVNRRRRLPAPPPAGAAACLRCCLPAPPPAPPPACTAACLHCRLRRLPAPLPPPDFVEYDEELEPEVTIIQRKDATVTEYRVNGRLYMVKVTPFVGKPYYFVDRDGDGIMESRMSDIYNTTQIPQWVIFSW